VPFPMWVAQVNKRVTNKLLVRLADRPPFAALNHVGRSSGKAFRIPLNAFPVEGGYLFALTYGSGADWVKNVLAADGAHIEFDGREIRLDAPRLVTKAEAWPHLPAPVRAALTVLRVDEFLRMNAES